MATRYIADNEEGRPAPKPSEEAEVFLNEHRQRTRIRIPPWICGIKLLHIHAEQERRGR